MAVYGCRDFLVRRQKRGRHQHHAEQGQDVTTQKKTAGLSSNGHSVCFLFAKITQQQQQNQQLHCQ